MVKNPPVSAEDTGDQVWPLGGEDPLEQDTATHSSILAWRIPCTEEPGGLQSMGSQRVRYYGSDLALAAQYILNIYYTLMYIYIIWYVSIIYYNIYYLLIK